MNSGTSYWSKTLIETIYGNLQGLKSSQLKQLQRLYHQRLPGDRTTPEFAQRLAAISVEINQPVCAYINRRDRCNSCGVHTRQTQSRRWNCRAMERNDSAVFAVLLPTEARTAQ